MSTISNSLTGSSLIAYLQAASTKAQSGSTGAADTAQSASTAKAGASSAAASKSAVLAASHGYQQTLAQGSLDRLQTGLAADLRSALSKAGVQLSGAVSFGVSSAGKLQLSGSDADKAKLDKFLAADTGKPSFSSRLTSLTSSADGLSATIKQTASISQAARYASSPAGLLSLYATLSKQQDQSAASFSFSASGSSLTYAGVLTSKA